MIDIEAAFVEHFSYVYFGKPFLPKTKGKLENTFMRTPM